MNDLASLPSFNLKLTSDQTAEIIRQMEVIIKPWIVEAIKATSQPEAPTSKYLTRRQVSDLLKISLMTLDAYCSQGLINRQKIGNRVLFDADEVHEAIQHLPVKFSRR